VSVARGSEAAGARRGAGWRVERQHLLFLAFIVPNFFLLGGFTYWPLIYQSYLSLTRWNLLSPRKAFVGLDNYANLFVGRALASVAGTEHGMLRVLPYPAKQDFYSG
jgi:sn-glycerol 3-phosphate transport system permease protein